MNSVFLILVAIPLGAYLLVLLMSMRDIGADENTLARHDTPVEALSVEHVWEASAAPITTLDIAPAQTPLTTQEPISSSSNQSVPAASITPPEPDLIPALEPIAQLAQETAPAVALESVQPQSGTTPGQAVSSPTETITLVEPPPATESAPIQPSEIQSLEPEADEPILPEGPVQLPPKGSPKYAFDYRGRLWVEKKNKGFFRQLRRPQLPPDDPQNQSGR